MFCPRCGRDNPPAAKYCNECGFALYEIHSFLQKSAGPPDAPDSGISGTAITSIEQAAPQVKEDPKKPYVQTISLPPHELKETPSQYHQLIQQVPEPENVPAPVPLPQPLPAATLLRARTRSPSLAAGLSLVPGLGQVYNGNLVRGIILFLATLVGLLILIIPGVCIWIFSIYDAFSTAKKINSGHIVPGL